jgi:hypothetical protein
LRIKGIPAAPAAEVRHASPANQVTVEKNLTKIWLTNSQHAEGKLTRVIKKKIRIWLIYNKEISQNPYFLER